MKLIIKALGQTIEEDGKTTLYMLELPPDCMVMFVSMETWQKIKDSVEVEV